MGEYATKVLESGPASMFGRNEKVSDGNFGTIEQNDAKWVNRDTR